MLYMLSVKHFFLMHHRAGNRVRTVQRVKPKSVSKKGKLIITEENKLIREKGMLEKEERSFGRNHNNC